MEHAGFLAKGAIALIEPDGGTVVHVFFNVWWHGDHCDVANETTAA